jgi:Acyl CoA binding protein
VSQAAGRASDQCGICVKGLCQGKHDIIEPSSQHQLVPSQDDFDKAAAEAKELPSGTSNDDQLILYGLFKQANIGDCNTSE